MKVVTAVQGEESRVSWPVANAISSFDHRRASLQPRRRKLGCQATKREPAAFATQAMIRARHLKFGVEWAQAFRGWPVRSWLFRLKPNTNGQPAFFGEASIFFSSGLSMLQTKSEP